MYDPASSHAFSFTISFRTLAAAPNDIHPSSQPDRPSQPDLTLYVSVYSAREFVPLDPISLTDLANAQTLTFNSDGEWPELALSADGSTFVVIEHQVHHADGKAASEVIVIRDGLGGPERLRITPTEPVFEPRLTHDGSRLIVAPSLSCGPNGCGQKIFHVYDTRTGQELTTIRGVGTPLWPDLIDPAGRRLYHPFHEARQQPDAVARVVTPDTTTGEATDGPTSSLQIAAYDLTTGAEVARIALPDVAAGSWTGEAVEQVPVFKEMRPAITLSADGTRLAVVDAAAEHITLIDAETLTIEETHTLHRSESLGHRILRWLGIAPRTAEAKFVAGKWVSATFTPDGRHLYLSGVELEVGDTIEEVTGNGLGLLLIDVATGEITGEALTGQELTEVLPSLDGRAVYVVSPRTPWWETPGENTDPTHLLRRLNPRTLEIEAEREFPSWPRVILMPIAPVPGSPS